MDANMEDIVDNSMEWLSSGCSSDNNEISNDQTPHHQSSNDQEPQPRVGDEYQAEIPELMMENGLQDVEGPTDSSTCWSVGLPVLVMWVYVDGETTESEAMKTRGNRDSVNIYELADTEENQILPNDEEAQQKVDPSGTVFNHLKETRQIMSKLQPEFGGSKTDVNFCLPLKKGGHFLPGLATNALQGIDYDSFLLGLYIFGKNLRLVKQFVGSRKMGDILANYYGKFYRTAEYLRWSQSRKMKTRRCIQGERIFTGWRLHELLSRIFCHVSEESKRLLIEVSNRFREEKISLEDYVFSLKDVVGVSVLVKAVSIGKGKQDLTGTATDPSRTSQVSHTRPEIPSGQACSSLTKGEIIKFLTGVRLSKAKAGDLFWEAVWPRLLARGWHSEAPEDEVYTGSNTSLVFLVPGVKKFSRRKLKKGSHYFDSLTDVLQKVAAEPGHLELESETENIIEDKEEGGSEPDVVPNKRRRCYLQPVNSKCKQQSIKFTIVDTSLFPAGKRGKVTELRDLPVDAMNLSTQFSVSCDTEQDNPKEYKNDTEVNYTQKHMDNIVENGAITDFKECVINYAPSHVPSSPDASNASLSNHDGQKTSIPSDTQSSKMMKFHFSRKRKSEKSSNCESEKDLTACKHNVSKYGAKAIAENTKLNGAESHPLSKSPERCEVKKFLSSSPQNMPVRSTACNPEENSKEVVPEMFMDKELSLDNQSQILIDLNLPHASPVSGTDESVHINNISSTITPSPLPKTSNQPDLNSCKEESGTEQQSGITGRRQSTRNRPLTTKALEAFAFEFSSIPKKKRRGEDTVSRRRS
ncbi:SANT domain-containing protein [Heracleum sosnowskyi]|uniref:SANT domain-containing protein n=1 Tax=Heracleum sosnowskyi TaxID=360622 RepID=A0AAD8GTE1_9APIA|nr:SANT domain-containing protein [Heracleum sosnowskyi]